MHKGVSIVCWNLQRTKELIPHEQVHCQQAESPLMRQPTSQWHQVASAKKWGTDMILTAPQRGQKREKTLNVKDMAEPQNYRGNLTMLAASQPVILSPTWSCASEAWISPSITHHPRGICWSVWPVSVRVSSNIKRTTAAGTAKHADRWPNARHGSKCFAYFVMCA